MFPNLIGEMKKFNVKVEDLSKVLERSSTNVRARLRGSTQITYGEACKIRDYLNDNFGTNYTIDYLFASEPIAL